MRFAFSCSSRCRAIARRASSGPYFGAWGIDEQGTPDGQGCCSRAGVGSHPSRWAAVSALYYEKTGDYQAREDAIRSLNYSTYFTHSDGKVSCCGDGFGGQFWFSDGYADYLRHFQWAMASLPEFAPTGQSHLLRSSSVIPQVEYGDKSLRYRTFDADSTEVLRLAWKPLQVLAAGTALAPSEAYTVQQLDGGDYVVRLHHVAAKEVEIQGTPRNP